MGYMTSSGANYSKLPSFAIPARYCASCRIETQTPVQRVSAMQRQYGKQPFFGAHDPAQRLSAMRGSSFDTGCITKPLSQRVPSARARSFDTMPVLTAKVAREVNSSSHIPGCRRPVHRHDV